MNKIPQKYWWALGGLIVGAAMSGRIKAIPVVGTVARKLPS